MTDLEYAIADLGREASTVSDLTALAAELAEDYSVDADQLLKLYMTRQAAEAVDAGKTTIERMSVAEFNDELMSLIGRDLSRATVRANADAVTALLRSDKQDCVMFGQDLETGKAIAKFSRAYIKHVGSRRAMNAIRSWVRGAF